MKEEMSIDELLNSYIDGELAARQETEVRRLIDNDPEVARRFQQIQKCKILINSLPAVELPQQLSDRMRVLLEAKTRSFRDGTVFEQTATKRPLRQRVMAVAAMIGLIVALTAVIYTIAPQGPVPERTGGVESSQGIVAAADFRSRLELKTKELIAVDAFIKRTIEENGFADVRPTRQSNRQIYFINCSPKGLDRLLANLDNIWDQLDSARLLVETGVFGENIIVDAVTTEQIAKIAGRQSSTDLLETAKDYAVLNNIEEQLPGREIISSIDDRTSDAAIIHKPVLTKGTIEKQAQDDGEKTVHLTIIVSR